MASHLEQAVDTYRDQLASFEARIVEVEKGFAEIRQAKGIKGDPGVRGPAGPIEAAVHNASEAAKEITSDAVKQLRSEFASFTESVKTVERVAADVERLRNEFASFKAYINETIKNAAENAVLVIASEYKLVSALDGKAVRID